MAFKDALNSIGKVRLRGGIFGKTALLLIVLIICVSGVAAKLGGWYALALLLPLMGIIAYTVKRLFDFSWKYPAVAVLDGPELVNYAKHVEARKGVPVIAPSPPVLDHEPPPLVSIDHDIPEGGGAKPRLERPDKEDR